MLPLDNKLIYRDYASWKIENHKLIEKFKENHNNLYERFEPVFVVIDHIYDSVCTQDDLDEDLENIFEIGFNYLNSQFNVIKIYYESLFGSNCDDFKEYTEMIYYLLYIFDLRTDIENHGFDSDIDALNHVETSIENMIMERRKDFVVIKSLLNSALEEVFKIIDYEYVSIIDIYVEIAENLGLYIYEEDEVVIGSELK
jgi:thiamine kinase-like enzyme